MVSKSSHTPQWSFWTAPLLIGILSVGAGYLGWGSFWFPRGSSGRAAERCGMGSNELELNGSWDEKQGFVSCLRPTSKQCQKMKTKHRTYQYKYVCHNKSCIEHGHRMRDGGDFLPLGDPKSDIATSYEDFKQENCEEVYEHITDVTHLPTPIREFQCDEENFNAAVKLVQQGIRYSRPLVLKGCMKDVPAIKKWIEPGYLEGRDEFSALFSEDVNAAGQRIVPEDLLGDLLPSANSSDLSTPFTEFLRKFRHKNYVWTSKGGRRARTHFGTFPNLHLMVSEQKTWWIASPAFAKHLYIDFVDEECPGMVSGSKSFGCDDFGCYQYIPFWDREVCISRWPRVKDVQWQTTVLSPGDVLLVPAFWFHNVWHHPVTRKGKNIAVTFIRQQMVEVVVIYTVVW
mmetsp:Transcript_11919/g.19110  ORF Transcript_11919/g.19110 Transcript_11919/m.19110 type:complete len:400 (+) Transcript_11919:135-1334(+)